MRAIVVLPYRDILICIFEHRSAVTVNIKVIGGREDRDHGRKLFRWRLAMHRVSVKRGCL